MRVRPSTVDHYPLALAPLAEQGRIVAEIERQFARLDVAVAALTRIQANLRRYRSSVLKAACEGRLVPTEAELARAKGRGYESGAELLKRVLVERRHRWEEAELAKFAAKGKTPPPNWKKRYEEPKAPDTAGLPALPEGWAWASVEQVGRVQLGRQRSPRHHHGPHMRPYLRVANVFEDRIDTSDVMEMEFDAEDFDTYRLVHGDILLNEGQSPHLVGRPAMFRDEVPGACFQNTLVRFRAVAPLPPSFALLVFRAQLHALRYLRIAKITTNIAHLSAERFSQVEFPVAPLAEQQRIVAEAERRLSVIAEIEATVEADLRRCERLRQAILKRAFEGRLVAQDPADEPAAKLLERVRRERAAREAAKVRHKGKRPGAAGFPRKPKQKPAVAKRTARA